MDIRKSFKYSKILIERLYPFITVTEDIESETFGNATNSIMVNLTVGPEYKDHPDFRGIKSNVYSKIDNILNGLVPIDNKISINEDLNYFTLNIVMIKKIKYIQ